MESPRTLVQAPSASELSAEDTRPVSIVSRPGRTAREPGGAEGPDGGERGGQQLLLGRYRLLERLGAGGFGVVWRAQDELLHREVAVKRIWLGEGGNREYADRAAREAHATARLSHPAIVALYEACPLGEAFYLISELVHGHTLGRLIAEGSLEDEEVMRIGVALAEALEHAHARGVIHRDIKPQNVLVPERPGRPVAGAHFVAAKLTDFGGASIAEEDALTRTGDVLGTLAYMAPEQSEGREVGEEADLYALSLVLYEALSGVNPVRGPTPAATARRIGTRLEALGRRRRDLPRRLTRAVDVALAPSARDRGTLTELREALQEELDAEPGVTATRRRELRAPAWQEPGGGAGASPRGRSPLLPGPRETRHIPHTAHEPAPAPAVSAYQPGGWGLPRLLWAAIGLAAVIWQVSAGRPGVGLLLLTALLPLAAMPPEPGSRRLSARWLGALFAPALGLAGLAGAYPAIAGQASRWRERVALGALGYWWLALAEPLLDRRLWLGPPAGAGTRAAWEGSIATTASHVLGPLLSLGVLLGALIWAVGALLLPWIVRGASAALDALAATVWAAAMFAAAPRLAAGLTGPGAHPSPRGALLGAILGGMVAVAARALRGPV